MTMPSKKGQQVGPASCWTTSIFKPPEFIPQYFQQIAAFVLSLVLKSDILKV
jgi:hypothetical protein